MVPYLIRRPDGRSHSAARLLTRHRDFRLHLDGRVFLRANLLSSPARSPLHRSDGRCLVWTGTGLTEGHSPVRRGAQTAMFATTATFDRPDSRRLRLPGPARLPPDELHDHENGWMTCGSVPPLASPPICCFGPEWSVSGAINEARPPLGPKVTLDADIIPHNTGPSTVETSSSGIRMSACPAGVSSGPGAIGRSRLTERPQEISAPVGRQIPSCTTNCIKGGCTVVAAVRRLDGFQEGDGACDSDRDGV
jgi:hypothetical protein